MSARKAKEKTVLLFVFITLTYSKRLLKFTRRSLSHVHCDVKLQISVSKISKSS
jgi:hypothetical protein